MALLDNGAQVNNITPRYVQEHSILVGLITDLMASKVTCMWLGNAYARPLGYVVIWVQVDGVQGYDEDQIALIIPDFSHFANRVPVILGTPTIGQVVNVCKKLRWMPLPRHGQMQGQHTSWLYRGWHQWRWKVIEKRGTIPAKRFCHAHLKGRDIGTFFLPRDTR